MTDTGPNEPMPESSLAPELEPGDSVRLVTSHRPPLSDGDYEVTIEHELSLTETVDQGWLMPRGTNGPKRERTSSSTFRFTVAGPRFSVDPSVIHSSFPPDRSHGRFSHVLPHVVLERTTLPWERSAVQRDDEPIDPRFAPPVELPPWLALLVFDASDLQGRKSNMSVADLRSGPQQMAPLPPEADEDPSMAVQVLDVPWSMLEPMVPGPEDLDWLTHVRDVVPADHVAGQPAIVESSTVVAWHHPSQGVMSEAHLVSLENWYQRDKAGNVSLTLNPSPTDDVRLVSLHRWSFFCDSEPARSFEDLTEGLGRTADHLRRRLPDGPGRRLADLGYTVLTHQFRHGQVGPSLYRGPFRPGPGPIAVSRPSMDELLPVLAADELLSFDAEGSMYDVSYAAAWELGRMLALQDPSAGVALHHWRTEGRHAERLARVMEEHDHLHHGLAASALSPFPISGWIEQALDRFEAVPFRYLVPDEEMLPRESMRFFEVDTDWLLCLRDGALSIGRSGHGPTWRGQEMGITGMAGPVPPMSGFLLRSDLVTDYPGLMIGATGQPLEDGAETLLPIRIAHLSPRVLLALYPPGLQAVDLHLHPQVLHFERDIETDGAALPALADVVAATGATNAATLGWELLAHTPRQSVRRFG